MSKNTPKKPILGGGGGAGQIITQPLEKYIHDRYEWHNDYLTDCRQWMSAEGRFEYQKLN